MAKTVVVLGGSMAGLAVTHRLLKYTLRNEKGLKVILVSKNSHLYWNLASVRAVIPGLIKDEELFQPIEPGLKSYPPGSVEFIVGSATRLDNENKTVAVSVSGGASRSVSYDYLVVATGARSEAGVPWKANGTYEECVETLHRTAERIAAAQSIIVAGAGPTGVELAAEIKDEFRDRKQVTLLSAGSELVGGDPVAIAIEKELAKLRVNVKKNAQASSIETMPDGKTQVSLINGETITTDLYLPATGLVANTEFLPPDFLTNRRFVDVDAEYRVKGAKDIWAAGDAVSKPRGTFLLADVQAAGVVKNIELAMQGKDQQPVKGMPVEVFFCSAGRGRGAGRIGQVPVPSFIVWLAKGRTLGKERTTKYVNGTMW